MRWSFSSWVWVRANSQGGGGTGTRDQTLGVGSCRSLRFFFGLLYYPMSDASKPCLKLYSVAPDNAIASISASPSNSATQANPQGTEYAAILDLSATSSAPLTWEQRMKERGSTTYEGLKTAIQGIYNCSAIFPPLQAMPECSWRLVNLLMCVDLCALLVNMLLTHQRVSANRTDLEQLRVKLQSILSIISSYRDNGGLRALDYRVEKFCVYVFVLSMPVWLSWIILRAINLQIDAVEKLLGNSLWTRTLEGTKDANAVLKVFRNISRLCDVFQVSFSHHGQRYPCIWPHRKDRYPTPPKQISDVFLWLVFTTSGLPSTPLPLTPVGKIYHGKRQLTLTKRILQYNGLFSVYRGDLDGEKVVTKIMEDDTLWEVLKHEALIYQHLWSPRVCHSDFPRAIQYWWLLFAHHSWLWGVFEILFHPFQSSVVCLLFFSLSFLID